MSAVTERPTPRGIDETVGCTILSSLSRRRTTGAGGDGAGRARSMSVRCPVCARVVPEATGYCPRCGASLNVPLRLRWVAELFWACPECQRDAPLVAQQIGRASCRERV